jgi:predicted O-methyltransferase YrrM
MASADPTPAIELDAPIRLMALASGYQVSQALGVAAQLGLADQLAAGPRSAEELARVTGAHAPTLLRLLRLLAAFAIVDEPEPGRFGLTPLGECLRGDAPNTVRDTVAALTAETFWSAWGDLLHCVRTGESAMSHLYQASNIFTYYRDHPELGAMMNAFFAAQGRIIAHSVVAAYDFSASRLIVDVGGGMGQLISTILRAHPHARGLLFDLPEVVARAQPLLAEAGLAERCETRGGDMFAAVPEGGDTYLLSRVLHDWDDAKAGAILANCTRALAPGATLLVVDYVLPDRVTPSVSVQQATRGDLNMLVRTGGRERTAAELGALLDVAGFALERVIPIATGHSVSRCRRR